MNKRIRELLVQNKDIFANGVTKTDGEVYMHGSQSNLEKFAELIVRDCLDIAKQAHPTKHGSMRCINDEETVRLIKERFGVEE